LDISGDGPIQLIAGVPTINPDTSNNQKLGQLLKFLEDQIIAWTALILLAPLMLLIGILIKLDSPGPIIYKQIRYGLGGKDFLIWKFRTMYAVESSEEFKQAKQNDPRITKVGKVLRKTSLDELPQLINVITGSMSIVGPRPHPEKLNEQYRGDINRYMYRHTAKPGITGLAQIKGYRGETVNPELMQQRVKYDIEYIRNWSLLLDIKILALTIIHLVTTDKAH
jgi:putative colanic acid biosynthesis UDP-glucose lipid carrier transferase